MYICLKEIIPAKVDASMILAIKKEVFGLSKTKEMCFAKMKENVVQEFLTQSRCAEAKAFWGWLPWDQVQHIHEKLIK